MCVVSMVHDSLTQGLGLGQALQQGQDSNWFKSISEPKLTAQDIADLRQLIADFREACAAAKIVDKFTGQPDCVDPEKAKIEERITKLEEGLARLEAWKNA